jgi:hypothetical protein
MKDLVIIRFRRAENPEGSGMVTVSVIPWDYGVMDRILDKEITDKLLPMIDQKYNKLISLIKLRRKIPQALDDFFADIPENIAIGNLVEVLSEDLKLDSKELWKSLFETNKVQKSVGYVVGEFRKIKKEDEIKYAEEMYKLSELFGKRGLKNLLRQKGIKIGDSTIYALCRVALDTPKVKDLVRKGQLKLTDLFWIKGDRDAREKMALKMAYAS